MSESYQLVLGFSGVRRVSDGALIPVGDSEEWAEYRRWWEAGGEILAADEAPQ